MRVRHRNPRDPVGGRLLTESPFPHPWYESGPKIPAHPVRYQGWKRGFDVVACLLAAPLVLPVLAVCCVAIVLDSPGSPIFTQMRTGLGGRRFPMAKLRTMVHDAERRKGQLRELNELTWPDFKIAKDPRVTRVGRILRKTSLDELPQLFNVLKGDMTLVGPRPTSFSSSTYSSWHTARLEMRSGLTGLWQVEARNDADFDERVRLDLAYGRHASLWLDLQIILRTVPRMISGRGAS